METQDVLQTLAAVSGAVKALKTAYNAIPIGQFLVPTTKRKLTELQINIDKTDKSIDDFRLVLAKLSRMVRSYSELVSNVRVAGAIADKNSEIVGFEPSFLEIYGKTIVNDTRRDFGRVSASLSSLPKADTIELGQVLARKDSIRDLVQELEHIDLSAPRKFQEIMGKISTQYSDLGFAISELLNRLLKSLDPN
ncbi:MAG: hypothetical protein AAF685_12755 [Cyanobacteria bacterium P01_C01_bin.89]